MPHVTLIRPPVVVPKWANNATICPPIGIAYLAGSLRDAGHQVKVIDSIGEDPNSVQVIDAERNLLAQGLTFDEILQRVDPKTQIFGFSCMFSNEWPINYQLIKRIRQEFPGRTIVVGGEHVNSLPDFILENYSDVDVCALGEGEDTLVELAKNLSNGESLETVAGLAYRGKEGVIHTPHRQRIKSVDDIALPAWDIMPIRNYLDNGLGFGVNRGRSMPMMATRGCPYQCTFCSSPTMWTTRWIARDVNRVLNEMQSYLDQYQAKNFDFYDLTAVVKRDWILQFCKTIKDRKMNFTWQLPSGTRSEAIDHEVSYWMYQSGCKNMTYAPESGSPSVLTRIKKRVSLDKMKDSMKAALKNGINIRANIILGFPGETHFEVWQSLKFIAELAFLGVHDSIPANFSPYPGSELFRDLQKDGALTKLDDEYFWNLSVQTHFFRAISYSKNISNGMLLFYLLSSYVIFYGISFLFHPNRAVKIFIINPLRNKQESRFERGFHGVIKRVFSKKKVSPVQTNQAAAVK